MQLNRMFGTKHAAMHYFDAAERKMIEQALERQVDWDGFLMKWGNAV